MSKSRKLRIKVTTTTREIKVPYTVKVNPGPSDRVVADAVSDARRGQFTRPYLCSKCGQEGTIGHYALSPGGTVECPYCGHAMMPKDGGA